MSRVRTKICGLTRLEDAQAAIAAGADALGFVFFPDSPRFIAPARAQALVHRLPPFPARTGLFVNPDRRQVAAVLEQVPLDALQFHGDEDPDFCASFGRPYIKAVRMKEDVDLDAIGEQHAGAAALLLDSYAATAPGGNGQTFDWRRAPAGLSLPLILAGGLTPDNVRLAIAQAGSRPYAVDVSSGVERRPGLKDMAKMTAFINEAAHA